MTDFAYAHAQVSTLTYQAKGDTLPLAAHAESAPASGAACLTGASCATPGYPPGA
ncbi:hypothetical protein ACFPAF_20805 [Hymenobacter endophyticus]|uniref:Uncharacterized protein n=1 Tax=Hymenobacter endophyticus TaxID=3076335 RepID=A0ABU3TN80_9BACT|nr:hypothetical protein [Hymenobacter endophyticus]MDU0372853.1 hypothetical protein [Hymenobacter endophyticus]